jgi:hypothetical protein
MTTLVALLIAAVAQAPPSAVAVASYRVLARLVAPLSR